MPLAPPGVMCTKVDAKAPLILPAPLATVNTAAREVVSVTSLNRRLLSKVMGDATDKGEGRIRTLLPSSFSSRSFSSSIPVPITVAACSSVPSHTANCSIRHGRGRVIRGVMGAVPMATDVAAAAAISTSAVLLSFPIGDTVRTTGVVDDGLSVTAGKHDEMKRQVNPMVSIKARDSNGGRDEEGVEVEDAAVRDLAAVTAAVNGDGVSGHDEDWYTL